MQWQKEIYQYQEIPPPHCWQEVQKKLSDEPIVLGALLHEASEVPPAPVWDVIQRDIRGTSQQTPASVRAFKRPYLSYAAALAGMVLLGATLLYVANQRSASLDVKDLAAGISLSDSQKQQKEADTAPIQSEASTEATVQAAERSTEQENNSGGAGNKAITLPINPSSIAPDVTANAEKGTSPEASLADAKILYTDGNYIQLVKPNGEVTRVSYKLAGMVKSMQGKKAATAEQKKWMSTIDQWKSKLEQSSYTPSASNFFDIAGMLEVMEAENR